MCGKLRPQSGIIVTREFTIAEEREAFVAVADVTIAIDQHTKKVLLIAGITPGDQCSDASLLVIVNLIAADRLITSEPVAEID